MMPQAMNWKACEPYGRGSLHAELLESTFRTRRRADRINAGESSKYQMYTKVLTKHHHAEENRNSKVINRLKRTLTEIDAYRKVLPSFSLDNLHTMKPELRTRKIKTPKTFQRVQIESKLYHSGYSVTTLKPEVDKVIESSKPELRRLEARKQILGVAKRRSDFLIDRTWTDEVILRKKQENDEASLIGNSGESSELPVLVTEKRTKDKNDRSR